MLWARRRRGGRAINGDRIATPTTCPASLLPATVRGDRRHRGGAARRRRGACCAVPSQSMRENLAVFRESLPRRRAGGLAGQGRRDRYRAADERGDRAGRADRPGPGRGAHRAEPGAGDRRRAGRPRRCWPARTTPPRSRSSRPAPPRTSGRTRSPTSSARRSPAPARTSSRWPAAWPTGSELGRNTQASLMTRGLHEIDPAGRGDGRRGRHLRRAGRPRRPGRDLLLAAVPQPALRRPAGRRAWTSTQALAAGGGQVAEGVVSCRSMRDLRHRHGVEMPITEAVFEVCYHHLPPERDGQHADGPAVHAGVTSAGGSACAARVGRPSAVAV